MHNDLITTLAATRKAHQMTQAHLRLAARVLHLGRASF